MTDPFGPLPERKSRGSGYSTTAITMSIISLLSGLFGSLIGGVTGVAVSLNLLVAGIAALAAVIYAAIAKRKGEARANLALLMGGFAIVLILLVVAL